MVREALPNIGDWDVKIIGIDINPAILVKAKQARYSEWSLRATSEDVKTLLCSRWCRLRTCTRNPEDGEF